MKHTETFSIHLSDIRDLFVAPAIDPFSVHETVFMGEAGLERIIRHLIEMSGRVHPPTVIVRLPAAQITAGLDTKVHLAIERFANAKIEENEHQAKVLRKNGLRDLLPGLLFLGICFAAAAGIESNLLNIPSVVKSILGQGITIIGWVVLWHPLESFIYDPGELKFQNEIYQFLKSLHIQIVPE